MTHVNRYDEYGRPQDGALAGRFGYTGQLWLPEIGMYYYRARIYHPGLGRFMQPDPIGYGSGMNLYAYVLNDPINLADPSGMSVDDDFPDPFCVGWNFCGPSGSFFGGAFDEPGVTVIGDRCRVIVCYPVEDPWFRLEIRLLGLCLYGGGGGREIGAFPGPIPVSRETVNNIRCVVGVAGVFVEEAGIQGGAAGIQLMGVGAGIAVGGTLFRVPGAPQSGAAAFNTGMSMTAIGGATALIGAGMKAIGGNYQNLSTTGAVTLLTRRMPAAAGLRPQTRNELNEQARSPVDQIPACD